MIDLFCPGRTGGLEWKEAVSHRTCRPSKGNPLYFRAALGGPRVILYLNSSALIKRYRQQVRIHAIPRFNLRSDYAAHK
jgi:hypothetical protein